MVEIVQNSFIVKMSKNLKFCKNFYKKILKISINSNCRKNFYEHFEKFLN